MSKTAIRYVESEGRPYQPGAVALCYALMLVLITLILASECRTWPAERLLYVFLGGCVAVVPGWLLVRRGMHDDRRGQRICVSFARVCLFFLTLLAVLGALFSLLATLIYF